MTENTLRLIGYCGLYCGLCAHRNRIPQRAKLLRETLHEEGMDSWYKYYPSMKDTFPTFWKFLDSLVKMDCTCRGGGGPPDCKIRLCAKEKGVDLCPLCPEYPCSLIEGLAEHYVSVIQDGKRLRKIGLKAWVKEQEARAKRGVVYAEPAYLRENKPKTHFLTTSLRFTHFEFRRKGGEKYEESGY